MKGLYQKIIEIENNIIRAVLCTIISSSGSTPRKAGSKMLVYENNSIFGTIGGGALEQKVIIQAFEVLKKREPKVFSHHLVKDLDMCCGGTIDIYIEPILNKKKIIVFGAGHIGMKLAKYANELDFVVTLIDDRTNVFDEFDVNSGIKKIQDHFANVIDDLNFDTNTFVVILTHDHKYDREILALCSKKNHAYIGMIGSERKIEMAKKMLLASDLISMDQLNKVDMPIGINIKVKTPEEIAISILAKLIDLRNSE